MVGTDIIIYNYNSKRNTWTFRTYGRDATVVATGVNTVAVARSVNTDVTQFLLLFHGLYHFTTTAVVVACRQVGSTSFFNEFIFLTKCNCDCTNLQLVLNGLLFISIDFISHFFAFRSRNVFSTAFTGRVGLCYDVVVFCSYYSKLHLLFSIATSTVSTHICPRNPRDHWSKSLVVLKR